MSKLMRSQNWFRKWLGVVKQQAIIWINVNQVLWQHMISPFGEWVHINHPCHLWTHWASWASSQYPKRRLFVRSCKVLKPQDLYLELSDRSEIWQALRQQCCRCACQISQYDNLKYQSRDFETLRDLTKRRLFGYWDGALVLGLLCFR